jgi:glutathione S-transferase
VAPYTRALAVERIVKKHDGKEQDAAVAEAAERALAKAFEVVDRALASSQWLAGDAFTLADISLAPYIASLPMIGAQHTRAGLSNLDAWWKRVESRASVASVLGERSAH